MQTRLNDVLDRTLEVNVIKKQIEKELSQFENEITNLNSEIILLDKVVELFKHLLDKLIISNVSKVEKLVTFGLKSVFYDQNLIFEGKIKRGKGKIGVEFLTTKDGQISGDAIESFGGSVVVVESFLLRVISVLRMKLRKFLCLDESFGEVDPEYSASTSKMIREICEKLNFDVLLVTHNRGLQEHAHHVFEAVEDAESSSTKLKRLR